MKKVFLKASALKEADSVTEEDIGDLETLISEATKAVDKAVGKGSLHKNTGARRKSRMSKYKAGPAPRQGAPRRVMRDAEFWGPTRWLA